MNKLQLLMKLKKAHDIYVKCSNEQKIRLFDACTSLIDELFKLGYPRIISESLLMFGSEFYWKEHLDRVGYIEGEDVFKKEEIDP